jgi:hypothetical protein
MNPWFWHQLGVPNAGWFGVNIPKCALLGEDLDGYKGDVDILVGSVMQDGPGWWKPAVDQIAALEVKVSWYGEDDGLHATKEGRLSTIWQQATANLLLGFDRAALLWMVVTEPIQLPGQNDWVVAAYRAQDAFDAFQNLPGYTRLVSNDAPLGLALFGWASVRPGVERTEDYSGAGAPRWMKDAGTNPHVADRRVLAARTRLRSTLTDVLKDMRFPNGLRYLVFVLACSSCGKLFVAHNVRLDKCGTCQESETAGSVP